MDEFVFKKSFLRGTSDDDLLYNSTGSGAVYGGLGNDKIHVAVNDVAHLFVDGGKNFDVLKIYERSTDIMDHMENRGDNVLIFYESGQVIVANEVEKIVIRHDVEQWEFA